MAWRMAAAAARTHGDAGSCSRPPDLGDRRASVRVGASARRRRPGSSSAAASSRTRRPRRPGSGSRESRFRARAAGRPACHRRAAQRPGRPSSTRPRSRGTTGLVAARGAAQQPASMSAAYDRVFARPAAACAVATGGGRALGLAGGIRSCAQEAPGRRRHDQARAWAASSPGRMQGAPPRSGPGRGRGRSSSAERAAGEMRARRPRPAVVQPDAWKTHSPRTRSNGGGSLSRLLRSAYCYARPDDRDRRSDRLRRPELDARSAVRQTTQRGKSPSGEAGDGT